MFGQNPVPVECYNSQVSPIKSVDPHNIDFSDLYFLKNILQDKQVVILGEKDHGDGLTFEAKTRLIKFLVEELNFNTLAFEGGGFGEIYYASENIKKGADSRTELSKSWYSMWSESEQVQPLLDFIAHNNNSIKLLGIEDQLGTDYSLQLPKILDTLIGKAAFTSVDYKSFEKQFLYFYYYTITLDSSYRILANTNELINKLDIIKKNISGVSSEHADAMLQSIANIKTYLRQFNYSLGTYMDQNEAICMRDSIMADNIFWNLKHHPNDKIIVWTAAFHGAHNLDQALYKENDDFYQVFKPMGHRLREKFGDSVYSIAFNSFDGESATIAEPEPRQIKPEINTWDFELAQLYTGPYAFIDFEKIRENPICSNYRFNSNIINNHTGNWFNIFDGVFFIRTMTRSTGKK